MSAAPHVATAASDEPKLPEPSRWLVAYGWMLLLVAALGLIPTSLLVRESMHLAVHHTESSGLCTSLGFSCAGALTSDDAKFHGVVLSYAGFSWYAGLLTFMTIAMLARRAGQGWPNHPWPTLLLLATLLPAIPAMMLIEKLYLNEGAYDPCPLCLATHSVTLALALLMIPAWLGAMGYQRARHRASKAGGAQAAAPASWPLLLAAMVAAAGMGGSSLAGLHFTELYRVHQSTARQLDELMELPGVQQELLIARVRDIDPAALEQLTQRPFPTFGSPDAPVLLTEISDFSCPNCRDVHPRLKTLMREYRDIVRMEFVNMPLDKACNPFVQGSRRLPVCEAHLAAIAAGQQGRFYEYADSLFVYQARLGEGLWDTFAQNIGLDLERFDEDRRSAEVEAILLRDVQFAHQLGITGTPRFMVTFPGQAPQLMPPGIAVDVMFDLILERYGEMLDAEEAATDEPLAAESADGPVEPGSGAAASPASEAADVTEAEPTAGETANEPEGVPADQN